VAEVDEAVDIGKAVDLDEGASTISSAGIRYENQYYKKQRKAQAAGNGHATAAVATSIAIIAP
jgi:hypothetical protein